MVAARTILSPAFTRKVPAGVPASLLSLPPVMEQALVEFGLMPAFRVTSAERKQDYVRWVDASPSEAIKRDRIADVLDELSVGSAAYSPRNWGTS